jgi:hypothetical protein
MICTGRTCTVCDTMIDIRVYSALAGTEFASLRTQGPMNGEVELVAIAFQDSVSLLQASEILTTLLRRRPTAADSLRVEWSDGRDRVRLVKGHGRPAAAVVSAIPKPSDGPGCPAR